jgi:dolichol-phosphate mannosyltransferase
METLVIVPTYNEATTIPTVIASVGDLGFDLLVVDDGSPDGTADIVEEASRQGADVEVLRRSSKAGLGSAYRAGFDWALARGRYDVVCQMDADLSHDPADLKRLVDEVRNGADLAIGSRYVHGGATRGWSRSRHRLSKGGNAYMRVVTGIPMRDMTAGFRAWRTPAIQDLALCSTESEGYSFQLETTSLAWIGDKRMAEVPIVFTERAEGESKMSKAIIAEAMWRVLVLGWRVRRSRPAGRGGRSTVRPVDRRDGRDHRARRSPWSDGASRDQAA